MIRVGSVIVSETGTHVVTYVRGGQVIETQPLEEYVRKNVFIEYEGTYRTLEEVIQINCRDYLSKPENFK